MSAAALIVSLNPGDTVALSRLGRPEHTVTGVVYEIKNELYAGPLRLRYSNGRPCAYAHHMRIEVLERVDSLYVNHCRRYPVDGDVVRGADDLTGIDTWLFDSYAKTDPWNQGGSADTYNRSELPERLRLLVDGETGQVVQ